MKPDRVEIDGVDVTAHVVDLDLRPDPAPYGEPSKAYLAGLGPTELRLPGTFRGPASAYEVTGLYEPCTLCRCPADEPKATVTSVSMRRDPNPAGSHLRTEEPIYITPHRLPCGPTKQGASR